MNDEDARYGEESRLLSEGQRREFADLLAVAPLEERLQALDFLARSGWEGVALNVQRASSIPPYARTHPITPYYVLPWQTSYSISCELPNNTHKDQDSHFYRCQGNPHHDFCRQHHFVHDKCPVCGNDLDLKP